MIKKSPIYPRTMYIPQTDFSNDQQNDQQYEVNFFKPIKQIMMLETLHLEESEVIQNVQSVIVSKFNSNDIINSIFLIIQAQNFNYIKCEDDLFINQIEELKVLITDILYSGISEIIEFNPSILYSFINDMCGYFVLEPTYTDMLMELLPVKYKFFFDERVDKISMEDKEKLNTIVNCLIEEGCDFLIDMFPKPQK